MTAAVTTVMMPAVVLVLLLLMLVCLKASDSLRLCHNKLCIAAAMLLMTMAMTMTGASTR